MTIKIEVEWTNIQKFLSVIEGTLVVYYVDEPMLQYKELYSCHVTIQENTTSFSKIDGKRGMPGILTKLLYDEIHCMLDSYYKGFLLSDQIYHWVDDSSGYSDLSTWGKKKYKALSKESKENFKMQCFSRDANIEKELVKNLKGLQKNAIRRF